MSNCPHHAMIEKNIESALGSAERAHRRVNDIDKETAQLTLRMGFVEKIVYGAVMIGLLSLVGQIVNLTFNNPSRQPIVVKIDRTAITPNQLP